MERTTRNDQMVKIRRRRRLRSEASVNAILTTSRDARSLAKADRLQAKPVGNDGKSPWIDC